MTFVAQAQKREIPGFEDWYSPFQSSWQNDPIMVWAKNARNTIEKRGDLKTHSQVRASIIAGYMEGPETLWLPQALFSTPQAIFNSVPKKFLIPHVRENGTLLIERRWIDNELPDMEILEALAHVYCQLADMVVSLLEHVDESVPPVVAETKPDAMGTLAMDRAVYLSMRDGSVRGFRYFKKSWEGANEELRRKLKSRYGEIANWEHAKKADSFRGVAEAFFKTARRMLANDGFHRNFTFFLKGATVFQIIGTDHEDRASRYVLMRDLAKLARIEGADGVFLIAEAWTAHKKNIPTSGFAGDARKRGEALILDAINSQGESFTFRAKFTRKPKKPNKIKKIKKTTVERGFQFILYPFMKEWGCVDEEELKRALQQIDDMGIETPTISDELIGEPDSC
ncbi:MAG: hypothetical protein MI741_11015 [Rhodospirillales bacterium]|nr:hypothetical protein [Rhodospirillales bacterium]